MAALLYAAIFLLAQLPSSLGVAPPPRVVRPPPRVVRPPPPRVVRPPPRVVRPPPLAVRSPPRAFSPPPRVARPPRAGSPLTANYPPSNLATPMNTTDQFYIRQFISESKGNLTVPVVACDDLLFYCFKDGHVRYIYLAGKEFQGVLPPILGSLPTLEGLFLQNNEFKGAIPETFAKLTNLVFLHLEVNFLYGKIPTFLTKMSKLRDVALSHNLFIGTPPKFTNLIANGGLLQLQVNYLSSVSLYTSGKTTLPLCDRISLNCLFGAGLPATCPSYKQRKLFDCKDFCDTTQPGGACGGHGDCNYKPNGEIGAYCICDKGYKLPSLSNSTCVPA